MRQQIEIKLTPSRAETMIAFLSAADRFLADEVATLNARVMADPKLSQKAHGLRLEEYFRVVADPDLVEMVDCMRVLKAEVGDE